MGCIFRPEALSWEDIDGGRGEMTMEAIRNFISEYCYPDEYADYGDDEELPNELVFFAEMWERLDVTTRRFQTVSKRRRFFR